MVPIAVVSYRTLVSLCLGMAAAFAPKNTISDDIEMADKLTVGMVFSGAGTGGQHLSVLLNYLKN